MSRAGALRRLFHVNVNCSSFERSRAFYEILGFRPLHEPGEFGSAAIGTGLGLPADSRGFGALLSLDGTADGAVLDLIEWRRPRSGGPPYADCAHLGAARMAFTVDDFDAIVERLRSAGVPFLSDPVRDHVFGGVRFVCVKDPDGTILEIVEFLQGRPMGLGKRPAS